MEESKVKIMKCVKGWCKIWNYHWEGNKGENIYELPMIHRSLEMKK